MFSKELNTKLDEFHLLKHPFYQAWNEGKLSREIIKDYAEQYYHHVKAFPRYISATHSICEDIEQRKILLENLNDEEDKHNDHPKLWKQFAVALGADKNEIEKVKLEKYTSEMIDNFFKQGRSTYAEGLASLYTYERQIPEIADVKIEGLKKFYGVDSESGLAFFETHKKADVYHRQECEVLLDNLSKDDQAKAETAALKSAKHLWNFLSGIAHKHNDHPKLWKQFAVALGADKNEIEKVKLEKYTSEMIDNFFKQGRSTYAEGLASLYTYERQIPEIADVKIEGLKKFYGVDSESGLAFFETHKKADVYHRQECEVLLDNLSKDDQAKAETAALKTAKHLWNFLSGIAQKHNLSFQAAA